jgi:hypothetical protein
MNLLSTKLHGVLDYLIGLSMIMMPWLLDFQHNSCESWLLIIFGASALIYSFCTNYELGFLDEIDFRTHLLLDFLLGISYLASPWLFGFYDKVYMPFVITGMIEILLTFITKIDHKPSAPGCGKDRVINLGKTLAGI